MSHDPMKALRSESAKRLATETKTRIQIEGKSPRWLLQLMPHVEVPSGTYRVNRRRRIDLAPPKVINLVDASGSIRAGALRALPFFATCSDNVLVSVADVLEVVEVEAGVQLTAIGDEGDAFFVIADGKVEVSTINRANKKQIVAVLASGSYFGEHALLTGETRNANTVALTRTSLVRLSTAAFRGVVLGTKGLAESLRTVMADRDAQLAVVNAYGEDALDLTNSPGEGALIAPTYADYDPMPQEYSLEILQSVVRVQSRVADLYNGPFNQVEEQLRNAIEEMREEQENQVINHPQFGLLAQADYSMRIPTRTGPPTPDDFDELLSMVWKEPAFFLAHPRAIAAFGRECTLRGVPPATMHLGGTPVMTWRGVPIIPCDKLLVDGQRRPATSFGKTSILLLRVGEEKQGVVGLKTSALPGEQSPSLSVRLMGISNTAMQEYLLTLYWNVAVLTSDAVAVLENCDVGSYHGYTKRAD